jgi:signal transduction histidine kinase
LTEEAVDDLERIQNATGKMQHLINDLLDLSRIARQGQPFRKVELKLLTEEVIAELRYTHKDIRNRIELNGSLAIEADQNQIRQMMTQLLDNALKFHKSGKPSSVKINIQAAPRNQCQITITDDGFGIKQEYFSKIFDTFVRLHSGTEYSGTGIGLSLVKKIIERHNGSIFVESILGEGSTFIVMLPVHNRAAQNTPLPTFETV